MRRENSGKHEESTRKGRPFHQRIKMYKKENPKTNPRIEKITQEIVTL